VTGDKRLLRVRANGIEVEVDDRGPREAPPLLMIMGLGMQLTGWPDELVELLVERGFRVVRFDNRDAGLSTGCDALGVPNMPWLFMRATLGFKVGAPYTLPDMAADAIGVLDALGLERAHVCGASMGGMIGQHLAARHAARVRSLTLMMTSTGARHLPRPRLEVQKALLSRPEGRGAEAIAQHLMRVFRLIGSPGYPQDPERLQQRMLASVKRAYRPAGTARQLAAIVADGDRTPMLAGIRVPTQVIHGDADALIPCACGLDLARRIAGAQIDVVPGMGHDLPLQLLPRFADAIAANAARAG
jgi:pimeloyl-ACP methyl ester carboxylesterase